VVELRKKIVRKVASHFALIIVSLFSLFPIYFMLITAFSSIPAASISASSLIPNLKFFTLSNFSAVILNSQFYMVWLKNSLIYSLSAAAIGVTFSALTGYALSKFNFPGRTIVIYVIIILSLLPALVMVLPFYLLLGHYGVTNSYLGLIIVYISGGAVFTAILTKNFMDSIPNDLEESALIDGYTKTQAFTKIILPLSKPILYLSLLLTFVGPYTDYAFANLFLTSSNLFPLGLGLYEASKTATNGSGVILNYGVFTAFGLLMGIPIFIIYLIFQKNIISGLTMGAVK